MESFGFFGYGMSTLVLLSFMFAILGFSGVLFYFLSKAFHSQDAITVDTKQEALDREI
ncbi:hypothetical protein GCM10007358_15620 [Phocicoccus schoeneichii]|uniref:Uncharacterized protein n=1 Tax=Phocicoccus schoeneichii TaxID=1812261 RepID=A0A6V7RPC2_9BACL|nr:hypothetical protein [Jeotgalicoccus schoeneichii]GGH54853.1 hypothetical protein GCM10007358_15620 [Jeotgalicoccus schoeneichii]CAD2080092.1 hypothetical protein JEOSCH030_01799 [Jeotgalicoccus schoeneichii]